MQLDTARIGIVNRDGSVTSIHSDHVSQHPIGIDGRILANRYSSMEKLMPVINTGDIDKVDVEMNTNTKPNKPACTDSDLLEFVCREEEYKFLFNGYNWKVIITLY